MFFFFFIKTNQWSHDLVVVAWGSAEVVIPELYVESHELSEAVEPLILFQVVRNLLKIIWGSYCSFVRGGKGGVE